MTCKEWYDQMASDLGREFTIMDGDSAPQILQDCWDACRRATLKEAVDICNRQIEAAEADPSHPHTGILELARNRIVDAILALEMTR